MHAHVHVEADADLHSHAVAHGGVVVDAVVELNSCVM